jgi:hypothetical protein
VVHCHTWFSMRGRILAKIGCGVPVGAAIHSPELLRP